MRAASLVFIVWLFAPQALAAGDIPEYDVKGLCLHQASAMMPITHEVSQSVLKSCYREQQKAYDSLKRIWPKVPDDIRRAEAAAAKGKNASGGYGDYDVLNSLVLSDMRKRKDEQDNKDFQLKR